ncbi:hypothetical protein IP80_09895 [beta proteobacterium AAP65]|nr:hypothetical protein IP80_09895 [beta proteobacterium AAP65]
MTFSRPSVAFSSMALSATGACTSLKWRPSFSSGAQWLGRATASQGMVPVAPSTMAKSSANARHARPAWRHAGGRPCRQRATSSPRPKRPGRRCSTSPCGPTAVASHRASAVAPSQAQAPGCSAAAWVKRACRAGVASKPSTTASASAQKAVSTASFSRWWREPGGSGVSCAAPAGSLRSPGCMRKGAVMPASKSKPVAGRGEAVGLSLMVRG